MLEIPRNSSEAHLPRIKIFGLGGAGCNALDRIALDGMPGEDLVVINTDAQSLIASVVENKVQLGQAMTRGLGTGGDPEVGRAAAEEGTGEILAAIADANILFLVTGLGGGTGSGAAPMIAEIARQNDVMVVVFATLPFQFEGKRRTLQAMESLAALHQIADVVICFENDKMGEAVSPKASIQEAFAVADATIGHSVRALAAMAVRRGPVHAGFDEAASVVRGDQVRSLFGFGEATGKNRAFEALDAALKSPLLDRGRRLREVEHALVQVAGGPDLTLNEVQMLMEEIHRHIPEHTRLFFGAAVDPQLSGRVAVTILSSVPAELAVEAAAPVTAPQATRHVPAPAPTSAPAPVEEFELAAEPELDLEVEQVTEEPEYEEEIAAEEVEAEPEVEIEPIAAIAAAQPPMAAPAQKSLFAPVRRERPTAPSTPPAAAREPKAEQMQFEPVNRGRFEKSEPTIIDGQDLDVPTFLRRNARLR